MSLVNTIGAGLGIFGAIDAANDISDLGSTIQTQLADAGQDAVENSAFQGYGVSSGLGTSTVSGSGATSLGVGPNGSLQGNAQNLLGMAQNYLSGNGGQTAMDFNAMAGNYANQAAGINPNHGAFGEGANQAMNMALADPSQRQGEIFNQLMAIQNPELNRQQAAQMAQEHAMGRGGIAGSQYGGTSGDAAMAMARAQAGNQAAVNAMQQADAERGMFGQMAAQFGQNANQNYGLMADRENALGQLGATYGGLGNQAQATQAQMAQIAGQLGIDQEKLSYLPMEMQMKLMQVAQNNAGMAQTGQLTGQDYLMQMMLGGANAQINAEKVASELQGNLYAALLNNLGGATGADGSGLSGILGALGTDIWNILGGGGQ